MKRSFKPGQSLMEVVVAMGLVIIAVVALVSTTIFTQKSARSANAQVLATKLAEENIEQIRVLRDRKGYDALLTGACYTFNAPAGNLELWSMVTCTAPEGETITQENIRFFRKIMTSEITTGGTVKKQVNVEVSWQESGGIRKVENVTFFSKL